VLAAAGLCRKQTIIKQRCCSSSSSHTNVNDYIKYIIIRINDNNNNTVTLWKSSALPSHATTTTTIIIIIITCYPVPWEFPAGIGAAYASASLRARVVFARPSYRLRRTRPPLPGTPNGRFLCLSPSRATGSPAALVPRVRRRVHRRRLFFARSFVLRFLHKINTPP